MNPQDKKKHRSGLRLVIPFFVVLGLMTALSFCIPLRPRRSMLEKRDLAAFPEFTWEALASGSYFDDITTWFSDTFPGREGWIDLSTRISALHGFSDITIQGDIPMESPPSQVTLPTVATTEPSETVAGTEEVQTETAETTEPTIPHWGGVDAGHGAEIELGAVIQIGDTAFNYQGFSETESKHYAKALNHLAEQLKEQGTRVVSAPAPTSVAIMIEPEYLEALKCADQNEIIRFMHEQLDPGVVGVDTFHALLPHNDEYIYFRTDHHWTALGAYYSYRAICDSLGYVPAELESFEVWDQGEFSGTLAYKCARPQKLRNDVVYAYIPQGDITHVVYDNSGFGTERPLLQDMREREINTKYLTFIWSDNPLSVITNDSIPDAPNCILVKDSFGNCLAPFLTQNYHKVFVVDYRKFHQMPLAELAKKNDVDDVIFSPYVTATQSMLGTKMMSSLCGIYMP